MQAAGPGPLRQGGDFGGVGPAWEKAEGTLPEEKLSDLGKKMYGEIQFLIVHLVGIGGSPGSLYIDDVTIEKAGNG